MIGDLLVEKILREEEVNGLLSDVERTFPNFVAGIITDRNGFPIATKMPNGFHIRENQMALTAIAGSRDFIRDNNLMKVKRNLDKNKDVKMLVLLEKSNKYLHRFKQLKNILKSQELF